MNELKEEFNKDPDKAAFLQKLSSIDVKDGSLFIVPKPQ